MVINVKQAQIALAQKTKGCLPQCLPIESFKNDYRALVGLAEEEGGRVFLSSGTSLRERSRAPFSAEGLACYKRVSLATFKHVLSHYFYEEEKKQWNQVVRSLGEGKISVLTPMSFGYMTFLGDTAVGVETKEGISSLLMLVRQDSTWVVINKLEKLKGALREYHSIRINDQWRIIFKWNNGNASEVEIIDYHK